MSSDDVMRRYEEKGGPAVAAAAAGLGAPPTLQTVVVTCMDARIDVLPVFGLDLGQVHVLRNAGGVVTDDVIRSLAVSQRKLGTRDVLLVRHSRCGMGSFSDAEFADELAAETGMRPSWRSFAFTDAAAGVREDMALLRRDPFLHPESRVRGFVLDIESFALDEVTAEPV